MYSKIENDEKFIKIVENLVEPGEVSKLYFYQNFKRLLPRSLFKKILEKTSKKTPYMGFIIEPYSFFVFFKLKDLEKAKAYLPDRYELVKASIFEGDEPGYYLGMGVFNTRASTFWGVRHESYLTARDKETGLISWIFIDILTDTLNSIPAKGIEDPNSEKTIFTTNGKGDIFLEIKEKNTDRKIKLKTSINGGTIRKPDETMWIMGNTSVGHSKALGGSREYPFAVIFDPAEVKQAYDIPGKNVIIEENTLFPGLAEDEVCIAACFPFAQHYIADSPGCRTYVKDPEDMIQAYKKISEMENIKTFSTKKISKLFFAGMAIFPILSIVLFILLVSR